MFTLKGIKQAKSQGAIPTDDNGVPYIVQTMNNNMCSRYVNRQWLVDNNEPPVSGNTIVLGVTLPAVSYQPKEFGASQVIEARADFLNPLNGQFFVNAISKQMYRFSYQMKPGIELYNNLYIQLPITSSGAIDFDFMESFISELEEERISELNAYLDATGLRDYKLTAEEQKALKEFDCLKWKEFKIEDLFSKVELKKNKFNKRKDTRSKPEGKYTIPLVNAKHGDNGIMFYGDREKFNSVAMSIDIIQNGAIATGEVYPQPQQTGILWDAYLIKANKHEDTTQSLLYFAAAIQKSIQLKFCYEFKATWERVKKENIFLPIAKNNEIDFSYMQTFIKAIEKLVIKDVVDYADKKIAE